MSQKIDKMSKQRADYSYGVQTYKNQKFILMVDLALGHTSLTNDFQNCLAEIYANNPQLDPSECYVLYQDYNGKWNGWDELKSKFIHLEANDHITAMDMMLNHYLLSNRLKEVP